MSTRSISQEHEFDLTAPHLEDEGDVVAGGPVHHDTLKMKQSDILAAMTEEEDRERYVSSMLPPPMAEEAESGVHEIQPERHDTLPPAPGELGYVMVGKR